MLSCKKIATLYALPILAAIFLAVLGLVAVPTCVEAQASHVQLPQIVQHAQYDHSLPAANARLASGQSPAQVQVWFTERIEPDFSSLAVYNQARQRVDENNSHVALNNQYSLIISLRPHLADGPYNVVFQNVSLDDGHHVIGAFSFVIGSGPLPTNTNSLLENAQAVDANFNGWSVTIRWLNYLGMAALVGGLAFLLLVWRPTLARLKDELGSELSVVKLRVNAGALRFLLCSVLVLLVGWVAMLLYQTCTASGSTLWQLFGSQALFRYIAESHFGPTWLIRLGLIALVLLAWVYARSRRQANDLHSASWPWLLLLVGVALMLTTSLDSHAAASHDAWLLLPMDLLHLVSTGFWVGGLFAFIGIIPIVLGVLRPGTGDRTRFFAQIIPHFSLSAIVSVIVLAITGTVQAIFQVGSFAAMLTSSYGRALDIKIAFFIVLLCLGAYNLLRISPRMRSFAASRADDSGAASLAAGKLQRTFRATVRTEALLALCVLLVVGALTSLSLPPPPAYSASSSATRTSGPYIHQGQAGDLKYQLVLNPGRVGENTIEVALSDSHGKPVQKADAVIVRFTMLDMDMGVQEEQLQPVANHPGYYSTTSSDLSMAGHWQIKLVVRRAGFDDVQTSFPASF